MVVTETPSGGAEIIVWAALIAAAALVVLGIVDIILKWKSESATRDAIAKAAEQAEDVASKKTKTELEEYASVDLKGNWEALASLATAIKDLDRSSRLFVLALAFVAVAGGTAGLEAIGAGIGSIGP